MRLLTLNFANYRLFLIYLFTFLGPLGNLLTPSPMPYQFRTFYFLLPTFVLFFDRLYLKELKILLLFLPFLLYSLVSAYVTELTPPMHFESAPLKRAVLLVCESLFMFGAAFYMRHFSLAREKNRLIAIFLYAFFISLFIGYIFFFGLYLNVISLDTIERFSVETQFGYGILRFSPGSYPNEYGVLSSFASCVLLLVITEKKESFFQIGISKKWVYPLFFLTFLALVLSTTRAAYISFFLGVAYIFFISSYFRQIVFALNICFCLLYFALRSQSQFLRDLFVLGFRKISYKLGSFGERIEHWARGFEAFSHSQLFGRGYGSLFFIHNVYLELLFELGLIGLTLLMTFFFSYYLNCYQGIKRTFFSRLMEVEELFSNRVIVLGLIHVFWFAASNHNINHYLTWLIFLLFNMNLFTQKGKKSSFKPGLCVKLLSTSDFEDLDFFQKFEGKL